MDFVVGEDVGAVDVMVKVVAGVVVGCLVITRVNYVSHAVLTHFCRALFSAFNLCFCYVPFIINLIGVQISNFVDLALSVRTVLHPVIYDLLGAGTL